ncbi:MAG: putative 2-C-methyl-D-erythritol 4-phosphate cytidylyltransferase [Pseudomonadota bacterium]|jgi:2-C-methyl-D-erythritol 4-phosphate cytidylyltransferase
MGGVVPKTLLPLAGRALVRRTVETFHAVGLFSRIVVLAPADKLEDYVGALHGIERVVVLPGGAERQASVRAGIAYCERELPEIFQGGSFLVHDAARCLVSRALIERCLSEHRSHPAVSAALPIVDTLVRGDGKGGIAEQIDRRAIYAIQTPQVFNAQLLLDAHNRSSGGATDDASLVAQLQPIRLVAGERFNIKITTPEDLELGEVILKGSAV